MKKILTTGLLGILMIFSGGCNKSADVSPSTEPSRGSDSSGPQISKRGTIGISLLTMTNPFFIVIAEAFTDEAEKNGYEVIVTSGEFDVNRQKNQVNDFIVKKVAAIVLSPCESKSIGTAIQEANAAGIPVFTCDIKSLAPGAKVVSHIATDNLQGGRLAGEAMIEALGEAGGKVLILDFKQAESCLLRVQGYKEVIAEHNKAHPDRFIETVSELPGDGKKEQGFKMAEDAIQSFPDLAGIFAINDPSALGAYAALEKARKEDQVKIIAFDGQPEGKQAIKDGKIYADPIQFPDQIGRLTLQTILRHFNGEEVPEEQLIPTRLYRQKDGMADPELN